MIATVYVKGKHLSYQRGKRNTNPNTSLLQIEGVSDTNAAKYVWRLASLYLFSTQELSMVGRVGTYAAFLDADLVHDLRGNSALGGLRSSNVRFPDPACLAFAPNETSQLSSSAQPQQHRSPSGCSFYRIAFLRHSLYIYLLPYLLFNRILT